MRIAYLINQYPHGSHTFIRREILALEALGHQVERYSMRPVVEPLGDRDDQREVGRTHAILGRGWASLAGALLRLLLARPARMWRTIRLAFSVGTGSERGLWRHAAYVAEAAALVRRLESAGCSHLHAHFGTNSAAVAMLGRELGGPPYSFTVHGPEEFDKAAVLGLREKIVRSAFVVAISSFGRSQLYRQVDPSHWPKIHVVRCGLDAGFLNQVPTAVPTAPRLVCVGRLCEQKGQLLLVQAVARLKAANLDLELVLVGEGEMRASIEAEIRKHGLADRIRITGWVAGDRVREEILAARALVLPSFAEGLPVALMEALALGRPVISTYVAGIPELIAHGQSGWLVPAGSVEALADAMREVLSADPAVLQRMATRGRADVRELHDVRASAALLASLFDEVQPPDR